MHHRLPAAGLLAACLFLAATTARAEITYSYGSPTLSPQGRVTGSITTTKAAIADGVLTAAELSGNFSFTDTIAPFAPATFTPNEFINHIGGMYDGYIVVDRVSGAYISSGIYWSATDVGTGQTLGVGDRSVSVWANATNTTEMLAPLIVSGGGPGAVSGGPGGGPGNEITYRFVTTAATSDGGVLTGSIVVPKAAIADGRIVFQELVSARFVLTGAAPPYGPAPTTFDARYFIGRNNALEIEVDPATGTILHDFLLWANNLSGHGVIVVPHAFWTRSGNPNDGGKGHYVVSGGGPVATPTQVPTLHPLILAGLGAALALLAVGARRRRAMR